MHKSRIAGLAGEIMSTAVEATAAGRYEASAQFRAAGRVLEVCGYRLHAGARTDDPRVQMAVQLDNPYSEHILEQMLALVESMR
ncbi:hypothetical protein D3C76_1606330 [compost metagenome]